MLKIAVAALLVVPGAALAGPSGFPPPSPPVVTPSEHAGLVPQRSPAFFVEQYRLALVGLRTQALAFRAADGGTLSAAHRDEIQRKIDHARFDLVRQLRNNDPLSVDGTGAPRR